MKKIINKMLRLRAYSSIGGDFDLEIKNFQTNDIETGEEIYECGMVLYRSKDQFQIDVGIDNDELDELIDFLTEIRSFNNNFNNNEK